jgi:Flp pilus assembly protein TadD
MKSAFAATLVCLSLLPALAHAQTAAAPAQTGQASAEINALLTAGRLDDALRAADQRLQVNPRDAQVRFLRGVVLTEQGKTVEASTVFEAMTQEFPELPEPYNNLAVLAAAQGRPEQALRLLQQAIAAAPNYLTAHENMGDVYVALAEQSYQKVIDLRPASPAARTKLQLTRELSARLRSVK